MCLCVFLHPLRHNGCDSAPIFLSWVTRPAVAWLPQSGESFLLRLCPCRWTGSYIYSGAGVSGRYWCARLHLCFIRVSAPCCGKGRHTLAHPTIPSVAKEIRKLQLGEDMSSLSPLTACYFLCFFSLYIFRYLSFFKCFTLWHTCFDDTVELLPKTFQCLRSTQRSRNPFIFKTNRLNVAFLQIFRPAG